MSDKKPYWHPVPIDAAYFARLRADYPQDAHLTDSALVEKYNEGNDRYCLLWDNIGDAVADYQLLADDWILLRARLAAAEAELTHARSTGDESALEVQAWKRDAARYRWLRDRASDQWKGTYVGWTPSEVAHGEEFDAAIDAAQEPRT